jgi:peptide-methionine (S)-S-oxide reductase
MDRDVPDTLEHADFALGCFWGPDARFGALDGVVRTCVGYAGGTTPAPTYRDLGDHIETVRMAFDPSHIAYADLLERFWIAHDPTRPPFKRQYQTALFPRTEAQADAARRTLAERQEAAGTTLATEIIPDAPFHRAEGYHQKHTLRQYPAVMDAFARRYPNDDAFTDAPSAALANGYAGGYRDPARLEADRERLRLPDPAFDALRTVAERRFRGDRALP